LDKKNGCNHAQTPKTPNQSIISHASLREHLASEKEPLELEEKEEFHYSDEKRSISIIPTATSDRL